MKESGIVEDTKRRKRKINWFIGVDVSKCTLDYAVIQNDKLLFHHQGLNSKPDVERFIKELKALPQFSMAAAIFCMEAMGTYGNHLMRTVQKLHGKIAAVNPLIIKNFLGLTRGKNDKDDAIRIAQYAQKNINELKFWKPERPPLQELKTLFTLRERMLTTSVALKTPLGELEGFVPATLIKQCRRLSSKTIDSIQMDISGIESRITDILKNDEELDRLTSIVESVPGVGRITSLLILITTNEFRDISSAKKFACYTGVAPFRNESGEVVRKARISHFANKKMKSLLHLCALSALRFDTELKVYFERKTLVESKPRLLVINSVRYKIINRIFTCVRQNRMFEKESFGIKKLTAAESN